MWETGRGGGGVSMHMYDTSVYARVCVCARMHMRSCVSALVCLRIFQVRSLRFLLQSHLRSNNSRHAHGKSSVNGRAKGRVLTYNAYVAENEGHLSKGNECECFFKQKGQEP